MRQFIVVVKDGSWSGFVGQWLGIITIVTINGGEVCRQWKLGWWHAGLGCSNNGSAAGSRRG